MRAVYSGAVYSAYKGRSTEDKGSLAIIPLADHAAEKEKTRI
jgi:hypothetical protein